MRETPDNPNDHNHHHAQPNDGKEKILLFPAIHTARLPIILAPGVELAPEKVAYIIVALIAALQKRK